MTERSTDILSFAVPAGVKDLLRIRAARQKTSISDIARDVFMRGLPPVTDEESFFLASSVQVSEHNVQENGGSR